MDSKTFIRDSHSQAIINNDNQGFQRFRQQRQKELNLQQTVKDVENLKKDINEIKNMLQLLINGKVNG